MKLCLLIGVALLAGCASLPADPTRMSAEQLKEFVKDKNATISCVIANNPYGRVVAKYVNLDKSVIIDGLVTVSDECHVAITNAPKAKVDESRARDGERLSCYRSATAIICEPAR